MSVYARSAEIIRRVRLEMPVQITLPDPVTGNDFAISRENLLSLLVIDSGNIFLEGQTVAAFFAEMARAQRACERACARAEVEFRQWKAHMVRSYKATAEAEGKRGTDKDSEAYYRAHQDYAQHAHLPDYYKTLGYLFSDLKEAFNIKAKMIASQARMQGEHEQVITAEVASDEESDESTERLEEMAAEVIAASQPHAVSPPLPAASVEEEEEEEEEEYEESEDEEEADESEDDEEEEEEELPPPPPPPPKRRRTPSKKKPAKKTTKKKRSPRKRSA